MSPPFLSSRGRWRETAESLRQPLMWWDAVPKAVVRLQEDADAWQGIAAVPVAEPVPARVELAPGEAIVLDFGEHLVGEMELSVANAGQDFDSPVLLRLFAAETPYELTYRREDYHGVLSAGWMQEETVRIVHPAPRFRLPNRLALRYLRMEVLAAPGRAVFTGLTLHACSAAGAALPPPPPALAGQERQIHQIACRTLRNCMQGIFEDGPKRDRRLWLGDLRLQALANAATYRNMRLVERSLYLLAANTRDDGRIASCAYEDAVCGDGCEVMEYPLFLAPILLEHLQAYGRREVAEELFELAAWQFRLMEPLIDADGLLHHDGSHWLVIDHSTELEKETAFQGIYLFGLEALATLAQRLGKEHHWMRRQLARLRDALIRHRYDVHEGLFFSGASRQFSIASQAWAVLAKAIAGEKARRLLARSIASEKLFPVFSPYMMHYLLEACQSCGATALLRSLLCGYWGKMAATGATAFYEIYRPEEPFYSPYGHAWINSACHAWSCTPALYLMGRAE